MDLGRLELKTAKGTRNLTAGLPESLPIPLFTAAYDRHSQVWTFTANPSWQVSYYDQYARLVNSKEFQLPAKYCPAPGEPSAFMLPNDSGLWLALGAGLFCLHDFKDDLALVCDFGQRILSLSGSPPHTPARIAVTLAEGGRIYWPGKAEDFEGFAEGLIDPVATITNDGSQIAVARGQGQVYQPRDGRHVLRFTFEGPDEQPLAVMQADDVGRFAVATATTVYPVVSGQWPVISALVSC